MKIRVEDNFEDVLMKASTGWGYGKQELADRAGITLEQVTALLDGEADEAALRKVAPVLKLHADALVAMARKDWYPDPVDLDGLKQYNTPFPVEGYEEMTVNSYLVWNKGSRDAVAFDTGSDVEEMLADIAMHNLTLKALFLTHTHRDHIAAYDDLIEATVNLPTYAPEKEPYGKAMPVEHADRFHIADFSIEARLTHGHSPGGTTYLIRGLKRPVAMVGDSIFCLSQGGAKENHSLALENNRKQILSLSDDTILCPGHGPMTTVANEKARNPLFPEYK
ncbi:MAG: MBL fold metallo-hydrolase [Verrucomicrobiota bacterium]